MIGSGAVHSTGVDLEGGLRADCPVCHGPPERSSRAGRDATCWCCRRLLGELSLEPPDVLVMRHLARGGALHRVLRGYKDHPMPAARRHFARQVQSILSGAPSRTWDGAQVCAVVPSSVQPDTCFSKHPLASIVRAVPRLGALPLVDMRRGSESVTHLRATEQAYRVESEVTRKKVLVLDDTWVTGAHALSAVACLTAAGAEVVRVVVVGRMIEAGASERVAEWWRARTSRTLEVPSEN